MQLERRQQAAAASRVRALLNAGRKKSVHIALFGATHSAFKKELVGRGLSMQETFEYFASQTADNHPQIIKMLDELERLKRDNEVSRLEDKYAANLYDVIGDENPFEEE